LREIFPQKKKKRGRNSPLAGREKRKKRKQRRGREGEKMVTSLLKGEKRVRKKKHVKRERRTKRS